MTETNQPNHEQSTDEQKRDEKAVNQTVITQLEYEIGNLPKHVVNDLSIVRQRALAKASAKASFKNKIAKFFSIRALTPVALAVCLALLVNYLNSTPPQPAEQLAGQDLLGAGQDTKLGFQQPIISDIEPMPADLIAANVPVEDLELLQELEFAIWLSEQSDALAQDQQEVAL